MGIRAGIVGLPNVGKSTLFNALSSGAKAESANFPFCTIEPNVGVVPIPDPRLDALAGVYKSKSIIPTTLEIVDIAGLVKGAAKGEGLGNQFLSHIREVDAILHVVRCFEDSNIIHVEGSVDPIRDIEVIDTELALKDLESVEKRLQRAQKNAKASGKAGEEAKAEIPVLEELTRLLSKGQAARAIVKNENVERVLHELALLTAKPVLFIANVAEGDLPDGHNNPHFAKLSAYAKTVNSEVIPISAAIEAELAELEATARADFLNAVGLTEPGLNRVIRAAYTLLGLITYLTAGEKETRAWTVRTGATAPEAAGVIHSDFERGFIRAEVIRWEDLVELKSEAHVKEAGKMRVEGKEYIVKDGDVMHFRFNV